MTSLAALRHLVLFSFKVETSTEQVNAVIKDFCILKDKNPGLRHHEWGTNVSPEGLNDGFTRRNINCPPA
ncbi:Dabb family protein [Paucimonas lemoignei]|uniref:Dabb family protein n=1 Tax=Paucimonas lemoignei TaxID=29443 RepID=UPI00104D2254|nr:Dabb family protein [Paucimonas lemoignei]